MKIVLQNDWHSLLSNEFQKDYFKSLSLFLEQEYSNYDIFPPQEELFSALNLTDYSSVKVVILGQDPYHEPNQAMGLSFSVKEGVKIPPSLRNIYKEINRDLGLDIPNHGDLSSWARQGVLLLNTVLSVSSGQANSHKGMGWEYFTDEVIKIVNKKDAPVVFMLWGKDARKKKELLNNDKHLILETVHPSPLSARKGFFGCNHFSLANEFLKNNSQTPINWEIPLK